MVDIDAQVVELCRQHLQEWHQGSFEDSRLTLLHDDARRFIEENEQQYDVVISDLTEPLDEGPSYLLFTLEFYDTLVKRLTRNGVLALQGGSFNLTLLDAHAAIRNTLKHKFSIVRSYEAFIPSFDSSWGFIIASQGEDPLKLNADDVDRRLKQLDYRLSFYDGETHLGMFMLSKDIRRFMDEYNRIIEDDRPLTIY